MDHCHLNDLVSVWAGVLPHGTKCGASEGGAGVLATAYRPSPQLTQLMYQLNMILDQDVDEFILFLGSFKTFFTSETGLPDLMTLVWAFSIVSLVVAVCAAAHMICVAVDAWSITALFALMLFAWLVFSSQIDAWKWSVLDQRDQRHAKQRETEEKRNRNLV